MPYRFYDIESLQDVFTMASYNAEENSVNIYVLLRDAEPLPTDKNGHIEKSFQKLIEDTIHNRNFENFKDGKVNIYDLSTEYGNFQLISEFGMGDIFSDKGDAVLININDQNTYGDNKYHMKKLEETELIHDTNPSYNIDEHYYLLGYNSYNYDTTMLAKYYEEVFGTFTIEKAQEWNQKFGTTHHIKPNDTKYIMFKPTSAKAMRKHNDMLFREDFKKTMSSYLNYNPFTDEVSYKYITVASKARKEMLATGRYIDVARLNEKQARVALKRLLGMIGCQILESDRLGPGVDKINNNQELAELIAYNVSDVVNLETLFHTNLYHSQFELKREMLNTYPELVYNQDKQDRADNGIPTYTISPNNVRKYRLYPDSSSQQFASRCLCPDGNLIDKETVSFMYPDKKKCENGQEPYNVIESSKDFFYNEILPIIEDEDERAKTKAEFDNIYNYYKDIEAQNFDESESYKTKYPEPDSVMESERHLDRPYIMHTKDIPKRPNCIRYVGKDGKPTSCFVTFSIGGIHGAEFNQELYEYDYAQWEDYMKLLKVVQDAFGNDEGLIETDVEGNEIHIPGAVALRRSVKPAKAPIDLEFPDGKEHFINEFLKSGFTQKKAFWKDATAPELFQTNDDGSTKLNKKYVYTSVVEANHEDFTSYYPNMLRMMNVFENKHIGYDRYGEIFENKQRYNIERKDPNKTEQEREVADLKREGVKLILNTASGAGDATFDNPIRMNNNIIAMRIIGQNFSWRIGQAQAAKGARVVSTNTDGLYTVLDEDLNNQILEHESGRIGVEIEPERLKLISKDSNNRIEYKVNTDDDGNQSIDVISASGGDLACRRGPDPAKSLAHPAIVDNVLCDYLIAIAEKYGQVGMTMPFDKELGMQILEKAAKSGDIEHRMLLFQNVLASNPNSYTYLYGRDKDGQIVNLQHYNRVFFVDDNFDITQNKYARPGDVCLHLGKAQAAKMTPPQLKKLRETGENKQDDPEATLVLKTHEPDIVNIAIREQRVLRLTKVNDVKDEWNALIMNHAILGADKDFLNEILNNLNLNAYLEMVETTYNNNWRNATPHSKTNDENVIEEVQENEECE